MKKTLLLSLFLLVGIATQAQDEIIIDGNVTNVKDGLVVTLFRTDGRVGSGIATDTIEGGKFYFKIKPESDLDIFGLLVNSSDFPSKLRRIFATPKSHIQVNGNGNHIFTWPVKSEVKEQKEYDEYLSANNELWEQYQEISAKVNACREVVASPKATDEEKQAAKSKIESLYQQSDEIQLAISKKEIALMREKPVSMIWMDNLYSCSMSVKYNPAYSFKEEVLALYQRMTEADKATDIGMMITANLFPPVTVKVGDDMVDGDLYDLEGNLHHLSELKGKYLLLDFWSSGCGPCIMAIPEMGELQEKYADKLTVVSLSSDAEKTWKAASARHKMTWKNWSDKKQTAGLYLKYGVNGIPHYVLISPEGRVVKSWFGYGKGSLIRTLRSYMHPKPAMGMEKKEGVLLVNYPDYQANKTNGVLEIKQVESTPKATILRFKAYYTPNYWIRIAKEASLSTPDGKQYKVLKADGITLGKEFFMPESGEAEFSLTFEPLPKDAQSFNFQEGVGENVWAITGIKLVK